MTSNKKFKSKPIIKPVILAGGSGTRLWPLSRKSYPKQFSKLVGPDSLFQRTVSRLVTSDLITFSKRLTLTNIDFRFIVREQIQELGFDIDDILIEPESKNTAPSILAASIHSFNNDPNSILLVAPADHVIKDTSIFHKAILKGLGELNHGKISYFWDCSHKT